MSQAEIRDLALVRDNELGLVQQALTSPWRDWAHAWGLDLPVDATLVASAVSGGESLADPAGLTWQAVSTTPPSLAAWVHVPSGWRSKLAAQLVGRSTKSPMPDEDFALAAADRALADLLQRWRQALPEPTASLDAATPEQALSTYSGALLLTEPRSGLLCLLGRSAYRALLPKAATPVATPATGLLPTLAQHRLPVTLGLGEVEIPMSDLLGLQTGDVIQFPTRLSDDLPLTLAASVAPAPALRCQLGQLEGHLAIKVVAKAKTTA
ncbi:MAG: FliM/FliN family flagellar motor C-terminal domain-containing protein [Aquabacterium sp.]|uniref:FliM/FliN family flagellar motor C-terminal domain-containing protein n=1 Tax=Aquabacterium sp. TaxID=1872578 RepID=UPI0027186D64|nr:FliM/FliN family flagellar motor C-terminal domain-containing protein [Aquabacterium sp.]MDO9005731.1 FliM/FliN family flagellar motor C-terminal domain-containing protein [Aquabacterium sp.]